MATTSELEARIAELEAKLKTMEADRDRWSVRSLLEELFPDEVRAHLRAARKEQLLAMRSFIDHWIERQDERASGTRPRRESISVQ